jgi:hypothetical protein
MCAERATVVAPNLNSLVAITVRRNCVATGWHPNAYLRS